MKKSFPLARCVLVLAGLLGAASVANAQARPPETSELPLRIDTGYAVNPTTELATVRSFPVTVEGADWLRLSFAEVDLAGDVGAGTGAFIRITSMRDGYEQTLNAEQVRQWRKTSAYFNGGDLLVEVVSFPNSGPSRLVLDRITVGIPPLESQCGSTDDRVPSNDPRAARILPIGCTGWIINDSCGCFLTAGHCSSGSSVVQFNVPPSNANGSLNNPPPSDQYTVDPSSIQSNGGQGIGNDYAYFGVFPNTQTGLTPVQAQGAAYVLAAPPAFASGQTIRITGYGVDTGTSNQTQQTHTGPRVAAPGTTLSYQVDTQGGNSGSPIIFEATGEGIGIHTHAGCTATAGNNGTSSTHAGLQGFLGNPKGVCIPSNPGVIVPYGTGLGAPNIAVLGTTSAGTAPGTLVLSATNFGNAGPHGILWLSPNQVNQPLLGGTLLADLFGTSIVVEMGVTNGSGSVTLSVPAAASGKTFYFQAAAVDASQVQGVALSSGLQITFG